MKKFIIALSIFLFTSIASAQSCTQFVFGGIFPTTKEPVTIICHKRYAIGYSISRKAPLWTAEVLTIDNINNVKSARINAFKPDPLIPANAQPPLSDFIGNDFDRGHMVNFENLSDDPVAALESFYMSNMVAQYSLNNRGIWKSLEGKVRKLPQTKKIIYIVTGPIFDGKTVTLPGGTPIPTRLYKMILSPNTAEAFTLIIPNKPNLVSSSLPNYFTTISNLKKTNPLVDPLPPPSTFIDKKSF